MAKTKAPAFTPEQHAYVAKMLHELVTTAVRSFEARGVKFKGVAIESYVMELGAGYMEKTGKFDRVAFKRAVEAG